MQNQTLGETFKVSIMTELYLFNVSGNSFGAGVTASGSFYLGHILVVRLSFFSFLFFFLFFAIGSLS